MKKQLLYTWTNTILIHRNGRVQRIKLTTTQEMVVTAVVITKYPGAFEIKMSGPSLKRPIWVRDELIQGAIEKSCLGADCLGPIWIAFSLGVTFSGIWNHVGLPNISWVENNSESIDHDAV